MEKIFTPFYRTLDANQSSIGGVGLGLAVAKDCRGAGRLDPSRLEQGNGSRFAIALPAETPAADSCFEKDS